MKACYGKAFSAARDGGDDFSVAEIVVHGVERDIRHNGGAPAFAPAVDLLVLVCGSGNRALESRLLTEADNLRRDFADSSLTRDIAAAVETIGLSATAEGRVLTRQLAAESLVTHLGKSRCCDRMPCYIAKRRTGDVATAGEIVRSIAMKLPETTATADLASRMLSCSSKGIPAKAVKAAQVTHTAEGLNNDEL